MNHLFIHQFLHNNNKRKGILIYFIRVFKLAVYLYINKNENSIVY
jgi:hypothetical protein